MQTTVRQNLPVTMRDGTILRADVYQPTLAGRYPVVLQRTPYDKTSEGTVEHAQNMASDGYIVVLQDVRGRHASDGELKMGFFGSDHHDAEDGYDTVEWAATIPESNGRVGTFGSSYAGWTQWEMAHTRPPHLVTMIPGMIAANLLERELSGVLRTGRILWWSVNNLSVDTRVRSGSQGPKDRAEAERLYLERDRDKWLWYLPLADIPEDALGGVVPLWRNWLQDHATDHFGFTKRHREVNVPALNLTGWYDQQIGTIRHFTGMTSNGMTEHARNSQRLIIGPWTHGYDFVRRVGQVDFGKAAEWDFLTICKQWFDLWLKKDNESEAANWSPVQLFVMGANRWRHEQEWPLPQTRYTEFYIHSGGQANTAAGDGTLSETPPETESPDIYEYDPRDPVMTLYSPGGQQEPYDQRSLDSRKDVLVFTTSPLKNTIEVTGPVSAKIFASSSAVDTDWIIKLIDVWPNGFAQELCHGILRARYRDGFESPALLKPGEIYEFDITLNPTSNLFKVGHRIRVDVTSSDFPNFDRNHNTGGNDYFETELVTARQTIFHDRVRPSRVILPVIA